MVAYYRTYKHKVEIDGKIHSTYGIQIEEKSNMVADGKIIYVPDVSVDKDFVEGLVQLFNQEELEVIHVIDVIEDRIGII